MILRTVGVFLAVVALSVSPARAAILCIAIADAPTSELLKQEGTCNRRITPASTFKLALSLMGFDSGYLIDEHRPALPFHESYPAWAKSWKVTTDPAAWMKNSVVWYSWRIIAALGEERFKHYVDLFDYGNKDVSGNPGKNDGLTQSWLTSSLKISPLEQLAFLRKLVNREFPVSSHAYDMTGRLTAIETLPNGWEVHGKTGTGFRLDENGSVDHARQIGWFVGWASKGKRSVVFAYSIQDEKIESIRAGLRAREALLKELTRLFGADKY